MLIKQLSMILCSLIAVDCAALAAPNASGPVLAAAQGKTVNLSLNFAGVDRTYLLHVPANYSAQRNAPLMIAFHPHHGVGSGMERITQFDDVADANGFIVVYPDSNPNYKDGKSWQLEGDGNDLDFTMQLLAAIESNYAIDKSKIYISGFSEGGGMVQRLSCNHASSFAGAAVVSENLNPRAVRLCHPTGAIKFVLFHGTSDPISPYNGGNNGGESGGLTLSAQQTAQFWATNNGCGSTIATTQSSDKLNDGTSSVDSLQVWGACKATVAFYSVGNAGHTWPGGSNGTQNGATALNLNASQIIWKTLTSP